MRYRTKFHHCIQIFIKPEKITKESTYKQRMRFGTAHFILKFRNDVYNFCISRILIHLTYIFILFRDSYLKWPTWNYKLKLLASYKSTLTLFIKILSQLPSADVLTWKMKITIWVWKVQKQRYLTLAEIRLYCHIQLWMTVPIAKCTHMYILHSLAR